MVRFALKELLTAAESVSPHRRADLVDETQRPNGNRLPAPAPLAQLPDFSKLSMAELEQLAGLELNVSVSRPIVEEANPKSRRPNHKPKKAKPETPFPEPTDNEPGSNE